MRPLAPARLTLLFNAGIYGCLAAVALVVLLTYGSSLGVALPTAGVIVLLWTLTLRWMRLGPAEPQMEAANPVPEDAPMASTKQQFGWLAGAWLLIALPFLGAVLGGVGWLFHRVGERMDADISFASWYAGMVTAMFAGMAVQFWLMARWTEQWERERGVRLYTELWPLPKRSLAGGQATSRRRSRYYKLQATGGPIAASPQPSGEEAAEPLSEAVVALGLIALGVGALGVSGMLGSSVAADAFRAVAGLGHVLIGVTVLKNWHGIRSRLMSRNRDGLLRVFAGLLLFIGAGAIVSGIAGLLG